MDARLFRAARVANATTDGWLEAAAVRVVDGRIDAVVPAAELPSDVAETHEVHDLGSVSVLPGFVETHGHLHFPSSLDYRDIAAERRTVEELVARATANARRLLHSGATTYRDTGSRDDVVLGVRAAVRDGLAPGPRMVVTGAPITTTGGHYWFLGGEADTADEVVRRVRERKRLGADAVKVIASGGGYTPTSNPRSTQYGADVLHAAVAEAHRLGLPVLAHSLTAASNRACVEAGVDTVIHGGVWWTDWTVRDRAYAYDPAVADAMAAAGTWVDPTIGEVQLHDEHHAAGGPDKPEFEHWALPDVPSELEPRLGFLRDMLARGVRLIGGMGMGMPIVTFDTVAASAQVYARLLGMDPWAAIRTITTDAAEALGLRDVTGRTAPGLAADLVAVPGDPIADLTALRSPTDVILAGRPVLRDGREVRPGPVSR